MSEFYPFALLADDPRNAAFVSIKGKVIMCQALPATAQVRAKGLATLTREQAMTVFNEAVDALGGENMDVAARVLVQFGEEKMRNYLEFQSLAGMRADYRAEAPDVRKLWFSGLSA